MTTNQTTDPAHDLAVTFSVPGMAQQIVLDGGWRQDYPEWFRLFNLNGTSRSAGFGTRYTTTLPVEAAESLADYLWSVAEVLESMTGEERGSTGASEMTAARRAVEHIASAVKNA